MILRTERLPHQTAPFEKLRPLRVAGLFMEMGLGKSRTIIEVVAAKEERISRVLWFCPVSAKETTRREIEKHVADAAPHVFDHRTREDRLPENFWHVIGTESMSTSARVIHAVERLVDESTCVIVDESSWIKGHRSARTQHITRAAGRARYRYILTGTPLTQGVVDLYAQMRFLSPRILGYKSFHQFEANHLEYSDKFPGLIVRSHNTAWLAAKIAPYIYQVTKAECLPLPEKIRTQRWFCMTPAQRDAYDQAKQEILFDDGFGDDWCSEIIFRLFTALQQITCGFWRRRIPGTKPHEHEVLELPHSRLDQLASAIDELPPGEKVIIWAKYRRDIEGIAFHLEARHGTGCTARYYGGIPAGPARDAELQRFRSEARFLIATPDCGGHAHTLNEAAYVIFYNNGFKYSARLQAEDRNHRIGQFRDVTYLDLICSHSIDARIERCLARKANVVEEFKREVEALRGNRTLREALKEAVQRL